jgi:hypothetical protein
MKKPKHWMFTRETRLENGEQRIDGLDIEGVPVRLCTKEAIPGMHPFTDANGPEEETTNG